MNVLRKIKKEYVLSFVASLILFASVTAALAWTAPTATAPNQNSKPPVNIGTSYDIKQGKLGLFASDTFLRISNTSSYVPNLGNQISSLLLGVNGKAGATQYCDEWGNHCKTVQELKVILGL